jgi:hypothetical protein
VDEVAGAGNVEAVALAVTGSAVGPGEAVLVVGANATSPLPVDNA